jgi:hypothetical protein
MEDVSFEAAGWVEMDWMCRGCAGTSGRDGRMELDVRGVLRRWEWRFKERILGKQFDM